MPTLLIKNANVLVTMNESRDEIKNGAVLVDNNRIMWVGPSEEVDKFINQTRPALVRKGLDKTVDATGCVVMPGLVNCHHHLYQTLTRTVGTGHGKILFDWLKFLYPIWAEMTPEAVYVSAKIGLAELVLSGCTTVADHLYLFPNGSKIDDEIRAAQEVGVRFHPTRGSMSLGESQGGLPPDRVCDTESDILKDCLQAIETFHNPEPFSMLRIGLAPCSPFSVTGELMRESAELARHYPLVNLHTHLAETKDEDAFCLREFGVRPAELMRQLGWVGPDVWWAHCVTLNEDEITLMAETGTGVAHCPNSNMRLGSGIAPIRAMLDSGVKVGLAVDGSASNDSGHMLAEARQAMLLQRVALGASAMSAEEALWAGTRGGAEVLGQDEIGYLAPGMAADFVGIRLDRLAFAGAQADPLAALLFCTPPTVDLSVINGQVVVQDGQLQGLDLPAVMARHNELAQELLARARGAV